MRGYFMNKEERRKYDKAYREANREKINSYNIAYRAANKEKFTDPAYKEKMLKRSTEYYYKNREKVSKYYFDNKEKILEKVKKYKKENPEIKIRARHKRRLSEKNSGALISKNHIRKLLMLQKSKCAVCKKSVKNGYHVDHIYPLSKGGSNTDDNIQILCPTCNLQKSSKDPVEFMQSKGFIF